jgi:hypothetical protein
MNHFIKPLLILLGLLLVGYAIYFKTLAIQSPRSAWESSLANAARHSEDEFARLFNRIMDHVESGWKVVIVAGIAVIFFACFIKTGPKDGKS